MVNPVLGSLVLAVGLACALWPSQVAQFEEQIDAVGSTRSLAVVEPADWNVTLTRILGICISLFGVLLFFDI